MEAEIKREVQVMPVLKKYTKAARKYPWLMVAIIVGIVITEAAAVSGSLVLKRLIDGLSTVTITPTIVHASYITLGLFFVVALLSWFGRRLRDLSLSYVEPFIMSDLSDEAFAYLMGHSHDFFISNFAGTLTRRVTRYARSFENILDTLSFTFISTFLYTLGVIFVLSQRSYLLGIAVFVWTTLFIALQIFLARKMQPLRIERAKQDSAMTGAISDSVGNHQPVALFAAEGYERSLFKAAVDTWRKATLRAWIADSWVWAILTLFAILIQVGLLAVGVHYWGLGLFTVGDIVLIQVYIIGLVDRTFDINRAMRSLYDSFADAYEMIAIFEQPHEIDDKVNALNLRVADGTINFNNVSFNFDETRDILRDFNLSIKSGEKIALVGASGAGKSTVTKLLLRLHDVSKGSIAIDTQDTSVVTQQSLRRSIAYVPQEAVLFHRTLMDNIRYGDLDATNEQVYEASKKAHAHEFIFALPEGYDTYVGERGVKLSGGERQRIAIARAILKNAPILVLDEATASLDSQSEHLIQEALAVLMEGKTVIVIAHRLSTIMKMDRIIVMDKGEIVAQGTHNELLAQDGLYAKLWSIQAGGFLAEDSVPEGVEPE